MVVAALCPTEAMPFQQSFVVVEDEVGDELLEGFNDTVCPLAKGVSVAPNRLKRDPFAGERDALVWGDAGGF